MSIGLTPREPHSEQQSAREDRLLEAQDIAVRFGREPRAYEALRDCNLDLRAGEFVCLLGPSGCGKTTLLNVLAGFVSPASGTYTFAGKKVTGPSAERVVVFQDANQALFPWRSCHANVALALRLSGHSRKAAKSGVGDYLAMVGLADHHDKYPAQLSGGMRQRLQLARALAMRPQVLLMDEPFAALDAMTKATMQEELLRVWKETGATIVFVTHDINEALLMADRVAVMGRGPGSRVEYTETLSAARPRSLADPTIAAAMANIKDHLDQKEAA